jgi:CheY-specific phosphatase CheX
MSKIDVNMINPFIIGTLNTLKVQASVEASSKPMRLKAKGELQEIGVIGNIFISSVSFTGNIRVCFPKGTYLALMASMLG